MRPTRTTVLLAAGLVALLGLPATAAAAEAPSDLYVNHAEGANCTDSGSGSKAVPFCTISAAAKVVAPGQTVRIKTGKPYDEAVTIDRSGEPGKPIAFVADGAEASHQVYLADGKGLTVSGASHVVVRGLRTSSGVAVSRSADIELDRLHASGNPAVVVDGGSTDVRVSRSSLITPVRIAGGSRGTVLSRNEIRGYRTSSVDVIDAPATVVTNNTIYPDCEAAVSLGGDSPGSAVFNNLIFGYLYAPCPKPDPRNGIAVSASAVAGTRVDYNLIVGPFTDARVAYKWAGSGYQSAAAFQAATGQGAHDILAPSPLGVGAMEGSPTIDSGDPTAPGVLPTDFNGLPVADDPRMPNTGKDGGFIDRGARELQDDLRGVRVELEQAWAPVGTTVKAKAIPDSPWSAALTYHYDFGDGTAPVVTKERTADHAYASPCSCVVKVTAVNAVGKQVSGEQTAKVTAAGPLAAGFTATPILPGTDSAGAFTPPLTVDIDPRDATAAPWPVQRTQVAFGDGTYAHSEHLDGFQHTYSRPGTYTVTVSLGDSKGADSTVSKTVKVDYAASGYVATEPSRVLDTRTTNSPLQDGTPASVPVPVLTFGSGGFSSGGASAAVLNVTVTGATEDTHLSVWPSGQPRPVTSNVNIKAGGTSSNTVTVPVGADGKVSAQLNSGKAALIVDFVGYYQPNTGQRFSPIAPTRLADTRTTGGALGGGQTRTVKVAGINGIPADATAVALNLTGTGATENGHVIAYPDPAKRPTTSNLNLEPGKDKSNQAIVPVGPNGTITLYTNTGSTHLILDAVGYYANDGKTLFTPAVPQRLADTRTTGKLNPGATTTVTGLPAGAIGAALNVTATESTGPGFLTVYGHGTTRPEASSLNTRPGETVPNHVTTPVTDGRVSISNSYGGSTHVITDLLGYFTQG
ncbi:PKD domain-containing protein [Streptomyces sp. NPDC048258]|uniref:PKD domain-containing protein n=1 Tax=Streptomyces sp. NPDC048258 TaxID=3365527 RepID=UPI00371D8DDD